MLSTNCPGPQNATVGLGYQQQPPQRPQALTPAERKRRQRADPLRREQEMQLKRKRVWGDRTPRQPRCGDPWNEEGWVPPPLPPGPVDRGPFSWDRTRDGGVDAGRCIECDGPTAAGASFCSWVCWATAATADASNQELE